MNHTLKELSQSNMIYSGIYKINFPNNKCYIGQAQNIEKRIKEHNQRARKGMHGNKNIQLCEKAIQKYGEITEFEILEYVKDVTKLDEREAYWIQYYQSNNREKGYNLTFGGDVSNKRGTSHPNAKFNEDTLSVIIEQLEDPNLSLLDIAKNFNANRETIRRINEGISYTNPELTYPIREKNFHAKKPQKDILAIDDLLSLKEDIKYRWDLSLEQDLPKKYNISVALLRDINHGNKYSEYGEYNYPIRRINVRNKNHLRQEDILKILDLLRNTNETMENIGKKYNFGRAAISKINNGENYIIKDYNYPARKTK